MLPTETLDSLKRAFLDDNADYIVHYHSKHTPKWQWEDRQLLLDGEYAVEEDISDSQETITRLRPTEKLLKELRNYAK